MNAAGSLRVGDKRITKTHRMSMPKTISHKPVRMPSGPSAFLACRMRLFIISVQYGPTVAQDSSHPAASFLFLSCRDYAKRRCRNQSNKTDAAKDRPESVPVTGPARVFNAHGSGQWYSPLTASTMRFTAPELSFALIM